MILIDHPNSDLELLGKELSKEWRIQTEIHYCDLEIQKDQLEKRKVSIEAALNSIQNSTDPNDSSVMEDSMNSLHDF